MIPGRGLVAEGERGHRRGIVLGFTMAELMLLLLFCLLLVSAAIVTKKDEQIAALEDVGAGAVTAGEAANLRAASAEMQKLLLLLFPAGIPKLGAPEFDKLWRELVLARDAEATMRAAGLEATPEQLSQLVELSEQLRNATGLDAERLAALIAALQRLSSAGLAELTPAELDRLIATAQVTDSADLPPGHSWPPIISLADDGNRFETGSAEIKPEFRRSLETDLAQRVRTLLSTYDADVIEIIGHTDEQAINPTKPSNLDSAAIPVIWGQLPSDELVAADNAGLGMARAIAVASVLRSSGDFPKVKIVPLSAGQLLLPGDILSDGGNALDDRGRRRIDIRVRRTRTEEE